MDWGLTRDIGTKALMAGAGALLLYWTISALKLVSQYFWKFKADQVLNKIVF